MSVFEQSGGLEESLLRDKLSAQSSGVSREELWQSLRGSPLRMEFWRIIKLDSGVLSCSFTLVKSKFANMQVFAAW